MAKPKASEETQEQRVTRLRRFIANFVFTAEVRESGRAEQLTQALLDGKIIAEQYGVVTGGDNWHPHRWNAAARVRLDEGRALVEAVATEPETIGFVAVADCVELYRRRK